MTKARKSKSDSQVQESRSGGTASGIRVVDVRLRRLTYQELTPGNEPDTPIVFGGGARAVSRYLVESNLSVQIHRRQPEVAFDVQVVVGGIFQRTSAVSDHDFATYVLHHGSKILLPYAREAAADVTNRGVFGAYHFDPVILTPRVGDEVVERLITEMQQFPDSPSKE